MSRFGTQTYGAPTQWSGRVTAIASVVRQKKKKSCTLYVAAAGGGVWKSKNAAASDPDWKQITRRRHRHELDRLDPVDPTDTTGNTIYVGTGEPNGSGDSEAGIGLYKSTDGGTSWTLLAGQRRRVEGPRRSARSPSTRPTRTPADRHRRRPARLSSHNGGRFTPPGAPPIGLYESTRTAGDTWNLAFNQPQDPVDPGSPNGSDFFRGGVTKIQFDPNDPSMYYFSMTGYGVLPVMRPAASRTSSRTTSRRAVPPTCFEFAASSLRSSRPGSRARGSTSAPVGTTRVDPHGAPRGSTGSTCLQTSMPAT